MSKHDCGGKPHISFGTKVPTHCRWRHIHAARKLTHTHAHLLSDSCNLTPHATNGHRYFQVDQLDLWSLRDWPSYECQKLGVIVGGNGR
jgi:hypothetical protein